jgi:hypothetical protein
VSDCIHCDIHELLESRLQNEEVNLADTAKITKVLAVLILMAPANEQSTLMLTCLQVTGFCLRRTNPPNQLIRAVQRISSMREPSPRMVVVKIQARRLRNGQIR